MNLEEFKESLKQDLKKNKDEYQNDPLLGNVDKLADFVKCNKRTKLHNKATISWLKSRFKGKKELKKQYLFFPEELVEELKIKRIFQIFDSDGSNALDLDEMVQMFKNIKIDVDEKKLEQMYQVVDDTKDNALNYKEFKKCALSSEANKLFSEIMREIYIKQQERLAKGQGEPSVYLPRTFPAMITYMSYQINRNQKQEDIQNKLKKDVEKMEKYQELIFMNDLASQSDPILQKYLKKQEEKKAKQSKLEFSANEIQHNFKSTPVFRIKPIQIKSQTNDTNLVEGQSFRNLKLEEMDKQMQEELEDEGQAPIDPPQKVMQAHSLAAIEDNIELSPLDLQYQEAIKKLQIQKEELKDISEDDINNFNKKNNIEVKQDVQNIVRAAKNHGKAKAEELYKNIESPINSQLGASNGNIDSKEQQSNFNNTQNGFLSSKNNFLIHQSKRGNFKSLPNTFYNNKSNSQLPGKSFFNNNESKSGKVFPATAVGISRNQYGNSNNINNSNNNNSSLINFFKKFKQNKLPNQGQIDRQAFQNVSKMIEENVNHIDKNDLIQIKLGQNKISNLKFVKQIKNNTDGFKEKQKELQEREKQLLQEIKQDIFAKFINNNEQKYDQQTGDSKQIKNGSADPMIGRIQNKPGSSSNTWTAKHFHRELDILSEVVDRDISSRNNMFSRNSNMAKTSHSTKFPKVKKQLEKMALGTIEKKSYLNLNQ